MRQLISRRLGWAVVLACGITLSACGSAAIAQQAFEKVTTFTGQGYPTSAEVGPGPNGTERLYTVYGYGSSLDLVAYDVAAGTHQTWSSKEAGAKAMEVGADGRLYLGTYFKDRILRFDPQAGKLDDLGEAIPGEVTVWQLSLGPDGDFYGGTSLHGKLFQFDPVKGTFSDLGRMDPPEQYNRTVCAAPDGWVYCGIGTAQGDIVAYNIKTKEKKGLIPAADRVPGTGFVERGADGNAYGSCNGKCYRLVDGQATQIPSQPGAAPRLLFKDGSLPPVSREYAGKDLPIYSLGAGPDGKIYGSSYESGYFFCYDPASRQSKVLSRLAGEEAYSMLAASGKLFIATYPDARLQVYDPGRPVQTGVNPVDLGPVAPKQDRPFAMTQGTDGRIYIACAPGNGKRGGVLAWYDPQTNTLDSAKPPRKEHGLTDVCALPSGLIACGTSSRGGRGTAAVPRRSDLFLWDPVQKKSVFSCTPVADAPSIRNLAVGADGLLYGTAGQTLFAFDPKTQKVLSQTTLPQGDLAYRGAMARLDDGRIVVLAGPSAMTVSYASGQWQIQEIAHGDARLNVGIAVAGGHLYAVDDSELQLVRCQIPGR